MEPRRELDLMLGIGLKHHNPIRQNFFEKWIITSPFGLSSINGSVYFQIKSNNSRTALGELNSLPK
jgi:hypothetical protein